MPSFAVPSRGRRGSADDGVTDAPDHGSDLSLGAHGGEAEPGMERRQVLERLPSADGWPATLGMSAWVAVVDRTDLPDRERWSLQEREQAQVWVEGERRCSETVRPHRPTVLARRVEGQFLEPRLLEPPSNRRGEVGGLAVAGPDDSGSGGAQTRGIGHGSLDVALGDVAEHPAEKDDVGWSRISVDVHLRSVILGDSNAVESGLGHSPAGGPHVVRISLHQQGFHGVGAGMPMEHPGHVVALTGAHTDQPDRIATGRSVERRA